MDFSVVLGSPAIGNGKVIPELKDDYFGHPRPANARPTIGAMEYFAENPAALGRGSPRD
jgi:hypothetical protein